MGRSANHSRASLLQLAGEGAPCVSKGRMRALMPSGALPHLPFANAKGTFSRKCGRRKGADARSRLAARIGAGDLDDQVVAVLAAIFVDGAHLDAMRPGF